MIWLDFTKKVLCVSTPQGISCHSLMKDNAVRWHNPIAAGGNGTVLWIARWGPSLGFSTGLLPSTRISRAPGGMASLLITFPLWEDRMRSFHSVHVRSKQRASMGGNMGEWEIYFHHRLDSSSWEPTRSLHSGVLCWPEEQESSEQGHRPVMSHGKSSTTNVTWDKLWHNKSLIYVSIQYKGKMIFFIHVWYAKILFFYHRTARSKGCFFLPNWMNVGFLQ